MKAAELWRARVELRALFGDHAGEAGDGVGFVGMRRAGALGRVGSAVPDAFVGGPVGTHAWCEDVEAALEEGDFVGVSRDARTGEVGER